MIHEIHQIVWGPFTLLLFLAVGILYSYKSGFFQIFGAGYWWRETVGSLGRLSKKSRDKHSITQFQSACTALAATVGTGNIVGVATALTAGGAGAVFWMWISAFIGMMTAYAETTLGMKYRYKNQDGTWANGPMVYLERGVKSKWLALMYSFFCMMASLGMGSMVQSNSIAETLKYSFSFPAAVTGGILTLLVLVVIIGGISRIAYVSERLVPVSAGVYIVFSLIVICSCYDRIPSVLMQIWDSAFSPRSVVSGTAGYGISKSLQYGMSRGVFSNEAGLGSLAILHGAVEEEAASKQGMWAMFEVFFDTIISCTLTALVILCMMEGPVEQAKYDGAALTAYCFAGKMGIMGEYLVSIAMLLFAFATIIAWYYLGRQTASYLARHFHISVQWSNWIYTILFLNAVFIGCLGKLSTVWELSDIWNGLMALPNMIALVLLMKEVPYPYYYGRKSNKGE